MGRIEKTHSGIDRRDDLAAEIDQIERLLARLRRATDRAVLGDSVETAASTLAKRWARFTPTGDAASDRATLAEFEQQATSLLRKAQKQARDNGSRRVPDTAGGLSLTSR